MAVTVTICSLLNFMTSSVALVLSLCFVCGAHFRALDFIFGPAKMNQQNGHYEHNSSEWGGLTNQGIRFSC